MALTPEQKQKISDFVRQRIREGKPPLTPAARKVWDNQRRLAPQPTAILTNPLPPRKTSAK